MDNCNINDNHLFSDHVPLRLVLHIDVDYITVTSRPFSVKQAWYKATQCDIDTYKTRLDDILSHISLCNDMLDCDDQYCSVHKDEIYINLLLTLVLLPVTIFLLLLLVQLK